MNPSTFVGISHGTLLLQGENPGNLVYFRPHTQWDGVVICGSHRFSPCCMACGGGLLPPSLLSFQGLESYHCGSRHGVFIYPTQLFRGPWTLSYFKSGILDTCVVPPPVTSVEPPGMAGSQQALSRQLCMSFSFLLQLQPLLSPFLLHAA